MLRYALAGALVAAAIPAVPALANHDSRLPQSLEHNSRVRTIYPDLYRRELQRRHPSWARLSRMARTRWMASHPCSPATLTRRHELGEPGWRIVEARWACEAVPSSSRAFLACIARHEGGTGRPDVWYGGSAGWQGGRFAGTDRVVGYFQVRPYWARLAHPGVVDRVVSWQTYSILTSPVDAADVAVRVGARAYATAGSC